MYEKTPKPLRELARNEPLKERSRQMFTVPTAISEADFDELLPACQDFLTQPTGPTSSPLYTLSDHEYILNGHVADLLIEDKNRILECLDVPNGIKMIRVLSVDSDEDVAVLEVHFFNINHLAEIVSTYDTNNASAKQMFSISGGAGIRAGNALGQVQLDSSIAPANPAIMPVEDQPILNLIIKPVGDYSTYKLEIHSSSITLATNPVFDPLFAEISFKFRPGCFNTNCAPEWEISPLPLLEPTIDYLAKDYESFRLTMIAAMMERVPGWKATSEADLDMVLAELFSVSADELSDYQDRVTNEAFFASSRKRVSIARHARLLDYHIHQGNQASAWLALEIDHEAGNQSFELEEGLATWAGNFKLDGSKKKPDDSSIIFSLGYDGKQTVHQLLNSIGLYTWSDSIPVLKAGSTEADLKLYNRLYSDDSASPEEDATEASAREVQDLIRTGKIKDLLIQEHLNPTTGQFAGRNRSKRQLLRLLEGIEGATAMYDPIEEQWFVRIKWEKEDALKHDYCFTVDDCPHSVGKVENISLFHGNLVEVFQGEPQVTIFKEEGENLFIDPNFPLEFYHERTRWGAICRLPEKYLAYRKTNAGGDIPPFSTLRVSIAEPGGGVNQWDEVPNLIHSDDSDENGDHFVVETDENFQSFIRFGNGRNGKELSKQATVFCYYQIGKPLEGNIGGDKLNHFDVDSVISTPNGLQIRRCWNPLDATDGKDSEPVAEIIRRVPEAFQSRQLRAVTLTDYVARAEGIEGVSRAAARYAWTGSWRTVRLTIDPIGTNEVSKKLRREIADYIDAVRLIGEDFEIRPPRFVPLEIIVNLCVEPDVWIEDVKFVLDQEFSSGWTPDGRMGFFHPDLWTFEQTLHESQIIGRAIKIEGVEHIISVSIKRWNAPTPGTKSFTSLNHNEIIEVLNDPDHQEHGIIKFLPEGGRK